MNELEVCILKEYESVLSWLQALAFSKQAIKKSQLSKKILHSPAKTKMLLRLPIDLINHNMIAPYTGSIIPKTLYQDDEFLIFDKPSNMHCHPLRYTDSNTLLNFLRSKDPKQLLINQESYDRGLLHRLDYETSGVLVYVKKANVLKCLRERFSEFVKKKYYVAIVQGEVPSKLSLNHFLSSHGKKGQQVVASTEDKGTGQYAQCDVWAIEYCEQKNLSLVLVELFQGHRHQIRTQLAASGFPILGDVLYGAESAERLFLHSYCYQLEWHQRTYVWRATSPQLFDGFFNLDTCLQVISDILG